MSFYYHLMSVIQPSLQVFSIFPLSTEPLDQFQTNLTQCIIRKFKFVQINNHALFKGEINKEIKISCFFRTRTNHGTKPHWVKKIQVCYNDNPPTSYRFPKGILANNSIPKGFLPYIHPSNIRARSIFLTKEKLHP